LDNQTNIKEFKNEFIKEKPKRSKDYIVNNTLNDFLHLSKPVIPIDAITKAKNQFMKKLKMLNTKDLNQAKIQKISKKKKHISFKASELNKTKSEIFSQKLKNRQNMIKSQLGKFFNLRAKFSLDESIIPSIVTKKEKNEYYRRKR